MAHSSGSRRNSGKQPYKRPAAQSGQYGGQNIYRQNPQQQYQQPYGQQYPQQQYQQPYGQQNPQQYSQQQYQQSYGQQNPQQQYQQPYGQQNPQQYSQQQYQQAYGQQQQQYQQAYSQSQPEQQQLASNMPQQTFVQRGSQQQTREGLSAAQKQERLRRKREKELRKKRNRRIIIGILVLLIIVGGYSVIRRFNGSAEIEEESLDVLDLNGVDPEEAAYAGPPVATISFVGDVSTSADQVAAVIKSDGNYDFAPVFAGVEPQLAATDYAVANFETTLVDNLSYGGEPYYNAPVQLAGALKSLGIRLVSTANTYMLNNGIEGLTSTRKYLAQAGLETAGTYVSQEERDEIGGAHIRTIHKIKFAFLSYTKGTESVTMPDGCEYAMNTLYTDYADYWTELRKSQIRADVQAAKDAGAEVVVMLVHWGSEYSRSVSEPQKELASLLFSYGVDVIIGTHSHVVNTMEFQDVELADGTRKTCFVAYGLGDFYTDPEESSGQGSMILNLTFSRNEQGEVSVSNASYVPTYQNIYEKNGKRYFEVLDVYDKLAELYRQDEVTSQEAELYNSLLGVVESHHYYAGEEFDAGPADEDLRVVRQAIEAGEYSVFKIRELQDAEEAAAKEAAAITENDTAYGE